MIKYTSKELKPSLHEIIRVNPSEGNFKIVYRYKQKLYTAEIIDFCFNVLDDYAIKETMNRAIKTIKGNSRYCVIDWGIK